jgi:putative two-component system response regulator
MEVTDFKGLIEENKQIKSLFVDGLTGLYNLGFFHIVMEQEIKRCERQWDTFALCILDIDAFSGYNAKHGSEKGDAAMKEVAELIRYNIREVDLPFRCFEDVFAIVLIKTEADLAQIAAERIRRAINSRLGGDPTVSMGLASFPRDATTKDDIIDKAREALEHAKAGGRNSSFFFEYEKPFEDEDKPHILIVDDDAKNAKLLEGYLLPLNCTVAKVYNGRDALEMVRKMDFDIILLDIMMPGMNGYEVCRRLKSVEKTRLVPVVLVTALDDTESKVKGIELGADDFISKPVNREELLARTKSLIHVKRLNRNLTSTENVLFSLANAVEAKDAYTQGHTRRVASMAVSLGRKLGLSEREVEALRVGGILHDVGKIGISIDILNKQGPLDDHEWEIMKSHPEQGHRICLPLKDTLGQALDVIRHHHEKLDGSSYPDNLKGDEIAMVARVMAAVDIYDALITDRPYRKAMKRDKALEILDEEADQGKLDKKVVACLVEAVVAEADPEKQEAGAGAGEEAMETKTILVIEDDALNLKLVRTLLELNKYQMLGASDAEAGIQLAKQIKPDLILMDIQLPGLDGLEATRNIKANPALKNIPVIALSSYAMQSDKDEAAKAGCDDYITKPIDTKQFISTLEKHLADA